MIAGSTTNLSYLAFLRDRFQEHFSYSFQLFRPVHAVIVNNRCCYTCVGLQHVRTIELTDGTSFSLIGALAAVVPKFSHLVSGSIATYVCTFNPSNSVRMSSIIGDIYRDLHD